MEDSIIKDALTTLADLLSRKEYDQAEKFWISQKSTQTDYSYWHNLGVVYKLKQQYPLARFAFEKANHQTLYSSQTINELDVVVEKLGFAESSHDSFYPAEWLVSLGPMKVWGCGIILSVLIISFLQKKLSLIQKSLTISLSLIPLIATYLYFDLTVGFVTIDNLPIYGGASQVYATGKFVPAGSRLVGVPKGDWISLRSQSGDQFWSKSEDLKNQCMLLWE